MATSPETERSRKYSAVAHRAFECRVLHLVQGYGPIQDARFCKAHDDSSPATIFLRAELDGEYPEIGVTIHTFNRAQDATGESRHLIWDAELAESDAASLEHLLPPERIADEILIRARDPELEELTAASASDTDWRERYAAVERRAFEVHVLDLIQGHSPLYGAAFRGPIVFLRAELVGDYPKTYVVIDLYDRNRDLEMKRQHWIWEPDYASGDVPDVENMRSPRWVATEIMAPTRDD